MKKNAANQPIESPTQPNSPSLQNEHKTALWRIPLLAAAIFSLLAAAWGGLLRMGWQWPVLQPDLTGVHGPLMIAGFFGTLIGLERAVALRSRWPYLAPILSALGSVLLIAGVRGPIPGALLTAGSSWFALVFVEILRRHTARYTLVMAGGAFALAAGNSLWIAGWPVYRVVLWWAAFLILTIAGERLELGRLVRLSRPAENLFSGALVLFLGGLLISIYIPDTGFRLACLGLIGLALWLLRYDIARKTVHKAGLPRFAALALLSGYTWLAGAGLLGLYYGAVTAGFPYDAFLHAIFLGFTFSMIFAHAPIIFPAILSLPVKFDNLQYLPLVALHLSLLLRVAANLAFHPQLRMWGGMLNGVTILIFLLITGRSIVLGARERQMGSEKDYSPPS